MRRKLKKLGNLLLKFEQLRICIAEHSVCVRSLPIESFLAQPTERVICPVTQRVGRFWNLRFVGYVWIEIASRH